MKLKSWAEAQHGRAMALAKAIGVPPSFVSKILSGDKAIPAVHCKAIEAFTGEAVSCQEMRPDDWHKYWPELAQPTSTTPVAETSHGVATNTTPDAPVAVTPPEMDDHRSHSLRRTHADSPYDHSDIDRRAEEGPAHFGRRTSNGHAGDAESAQGV